MSAVLRKSIWKEPEKRAISRGSILPRFSCMGCRDVLCLARRSISHRYRRKIIGRRRSCGCTHHDSRWPESAASLSALDHFESALFPSLCFSIFPLHRSHLIERNETESRGESERAEIAAPRSQIEKKSRRRSWRASDAIFSANVCIRMHLLYLAGPTAPLALGFTIFVTVAAAVAAFVGSHIVIRYAARKAVR